MPSSTTMTIRLKPELKGRLEKLSGMTRRSNSFLAAEAIEAYVTQELEFMEMVQEGLDAVERGEVHSHEEVMAEMDANVEEARRRKA